MSSSSSSSAEPTGDTEHTEKDYSSEEEEIEEEDGTSARKSQFFESMVKSQEDRYSRFRSSQIQKNKVKRVMQSVMKEGEINDRIAIVMSGITKVYIGELVETARTVMIDWGHIGPIRKCHVREAYRRMRKDGRVTNTSMRRKAFKGVR